MSRRICKYSEFMIQSKMFEMKSIVYKTIVEQDDIKHPVGNTLKLNLCDSILSIMSTVFNFLRIVIS